MGYLFLDIETYIDKENEDTGLNPYYPNSKVISIAFNYYNSFILTEKDIIPPTTHKEWKSNEKEILVKFYNFIKDKVKSDKHIKLVGFNHIKFDLPYLFSRLVYHNVDTPSEIHKVLFQLPHHIDLAQISMITSQRMNKKKEFYNVNHNDINKFFDLKLKEENAKKLSEYYRNGKFELIEDYITQEFNFEIIYILLRRFVHAKKTMEKIADIKK